MSTILPLSSYPTNLDSDTTLFRVFDTAETSLSSALTAWSTTVQVIPIELNRSQLWADNGYITIEGELIYYASVTRSSGAVVSFNNCIRRVNGTPSRNFSSGTAVRGYVIAEHHNNLARAVANIESFIGTTDTTDKETIYWKLNYINNLVPYTDDAGCPQVEFYYKITSESPIQGTEITYTLNISTSDVYTGFVIDFGDGSTETQITNGTHFYPPNKKIDPTVTITSTTCETLQTTAQRVELGDLQQTNLIGAATFPVVVPTLPDFPVFDLTVVNPVQENIVFPPIVFPCLDLGNLGSIVVPSTISFVGTNTIPSVITFANVPTIPSQIKITSTANIPSTISIISDIPTNIAVIDNIPSIIDINADLPSVIDINVPSNLSISLIAPSFINVSPTVIKVNSNIPSVISVSDVDIAISLTSDYCTNCTGSLQASAPNTVGGTTDQGCNVCAGANQKITKVSVVLHDFFVQTFGASTPYSRYDLVKVLVVDPNGNTCLVLGGASAGSTSTPQFVMNDAVTLTFEDGAPNNIYDFSKPLKTGTYATNSNGNTGSRDAGQVNLASPAPAPSGYNGYGSSLSVFTDQPLTTGAWNVYIGVGPTTGFTNLVYVGAACVRVNSTGEGPCNFPTPTPQPSGVTPKPSKTPAPTPRRTNAPAATPKNTATPIPTPAPCGFGPGVLPWPGDGGGFGGGSDGGAGIIIPVDPGRPIPATPKPSRTPIPTPLPTPKPNCGTCSFKPSLESCGEGVCTYYWNFNTNSWDRCAECQSCAAAGGNCGCPEARWMVSFGILPTNGAATPTINTKCYEFKWSTGNIVACDGFCTYYFTPSLGLWSFQQDASYCVDTSGGCSCQSVETLVSKGILPKNPGTNKTIHTKCYTITPTNSCSKGCECPPAPTLQAITSSTQTLTYNCLPDCGTCIDEYINDLSNPCDPDPTDATCIYQYTGTYGWRLDPSSFCGCDNMECLSADFVNSAGLLPDSPKDGETFNLSCYASAWNNTSKCTSANCKCPPTPTPPPAGQQPANSFLINQCVNPTPTPSPTSGCGDCVYSFNPPVCGTGSCTYTYYTDLFQWTVGSNCGSSTCNCMNVEDAELLGLLPANPLDGEQVSTSCYYYNYGTQSLQGTWEYSYDTCLSSCECPAVAPTTQLGFFPGQLYPVDCVPKSTPAPTSAPADCNSKCQYWWQGTDCYGGPCLYIKHPSEGWKFSSGSCSAGCECPTVADLAVTISQLPVGALEMSVGCVNRANKNSGEFVQRDSCGGGCVCPYIELMGTYIQEGFGPLFDCVQCLGCSYNPISGCTGYTSCGCTYIKNPNTGEWTLLEGLGGSCYSVEVLQYTFQQLPSWKTTLIISPYRIDNSPLDRGLWGLYAGGGCYEQNCKNKTCADFPAFNLSEQGYLIYTPQQCLTKYPNYTNQYGTTYEPSLQVVNMITSVADPTQPLWEYTFFQTAILPDPQNIWIQKNTSINPYAAVGYTNPFVPVTVGVPESFTAFWTSTLSSDYSRLFYWTSAYDRYSRTPNFSLQAGLPINTPSGNISGVPWDLTLNFTQPVNNACFDFNSGIANYIFYYNFYTKITISTSSGPAVLSMAFDTCQDAIIEGNSIYVPTHKSACLQILKIGGGPYTSITISSDNKCYGDDCGKIPAGTSYPVYIRFFRYSVFSPTGSPIVGTKTVPVGVPTAYLDFNSYEVPAEAEEKQSTQVEILQSQPTATPYFEHTPAPTPLPSITPNTSDVLTTQENLVSTLAAIRKDRVKLCQFAEKEPLKMIKQGCGSCAIRKCNKFGLCSHTGVIEGHPEVICCQNCDSYKTITNNTFKMKSPSNIPHSQKIDNTENNKNNTVETISPISQPIEKMKDSTSIADEIISQNNSIKIVPSNSVIEVDLDELLDRKQNNEKSN